MRASFATALILIGAVCAACGEDDSGSSGTAGDGGSAASAGSSASGGSSATGGSGASAGAAGAGTGGTGGASGSSGSANGGSSGSANGGSSGSAGSAGVGGTGGTGGSAGGAGGTGGSGGSAGTGGSGGSGGCCASNCTGLFSAVASASDEFSSAATQGSWTAENFTTVSWNIGSTLAGHLTFNATQQTPASTGWFENNEGPIVHKSASGNFVVMARVIAGSTNSAASPPSTDFNSAGLLVRNPASVQNNQNWLMHNIGFQGGNSMAGCPNAGQNVGLGSESKRTVSSSSLLCLSSASSHVGRIAICRFGNVFRMLRKLDGEASWTQTNEFSHNGMSNTVDVGLIANFWEPPPTVRPQFDWMRTYAIDSESACCPAAFDAAFP